MTNYRIQGLNAIFPEKELVEINKKQVQALSVLSYFATSLFDKYTVDDVLWDITENCISRLGMEDCVIYLLDTKKKLLTQKAAYGNKNRGRRKILSPIVIPMGKGIVGAVAKSGKPEIISDVSRDFRYIVDDEQRNSELCVPLILNKKVIGVIDSEHSQKSFFNDYHLFIFELIARLTVKKLNHLLNKNPSGFTDDNIYYNLCSELLQKERLYRNENLSQVDIAAKISISPGYLSRIINQVGGCSFSDLVNRHRVEEVKHNLIHPDFSQYTIESIGYEAGFNSKSAFYTAFKKHTGLTPVAWRKSAGCGK